MDETHLHFHLILLYRLLTDPMALEAVADDKVEPRLFDEDNDKQLWRKGCENNQGYFTLENYAVQKFLTATSADDLKIISKSDLNLNILELEEELIEESTSKVLTYKATSGEFVKKPM